MEAIIEEGIRDPEAFSRKLAKAQRENPGSKTLIYKLDEPLKDDSIDKIKSEVKLNEEKETTKEARMNPQTEHDNPDQNEIAIMIARYNCSFGNYKRAFKILNALMRRGKVPLDKTVIRVNPRRPLVSQNMLANRGGMLDKYEGWAGGAGGESNLINDMIERSKSPSMLPPNQEMDILDLFITCRVESHIASAKGSKPGKMAPAFACVIDRFAALSQEIYTTRSVEYARSQEAFGRAVLGTLDDSLLPSARDAANRAQYIMSDLGLKDTDAYGLILILRGNIELRDKKPNEAFKFFTEAEKILTPENNIYAHILLRQSMGDNYEVLGKWNEAFINYRTVYTFMCNNYKLEFVDRVKATWAIAYLYFNLKMYEKAIPLLEEVRRQYIRMFGLRDQHIIMIDDILRDSNEHVTNPRRGQIQVNHSFRMCTICEQIKEGMDTCSGCERVWYCNSECQLKDWPNHKPICNVCTLCDASMYDSIVTRCSRCKTTKYCSAECQNEDWLNHKKDCHPPQ